MFWSPASGHRVKEVHVRAPTLWASGGGRSLPPGLLPLPVSSSRVAVPPWPLAKMKGCGFFPSSGMCASVFGGGEERSPTVHVNNDSVCYSWQLFHKALFCIKIQEPRKAAQG